MKPALHGDTIILNIALGSFCDCFSLLFGNSQDEFGRIVTRNDSVDAFRGRRACPRRSAAKANAACRTQSPQCDSSQGHGGLLRSDRMLQRSVAVVFVFLGVFFWSACLILLRITDVQTNKLNGAPDRGATCDLRSVIVIDVYSLFDALGADP